MEAKDVRNLILSLIILMAGIKLLTVIGANYIGQARAAVPGLDPQLAYSLESIGNTFVLGAGALTLLLIPVWLLQRSKEKKQRQQAQLQQVKYPQYQRR